MHLQSATDFVWLSSVTPGPVCFCSAEKLHTVYLLPLSRLDINECLEGTDACNRETQHCLNGRGNYTCQNKAVETCSPGFIYDSASKACEGLNIAFFSTLQWRANHTPRSI